MENSAPDSGSRGFPSGRRKPVAVSAQALVASRLLAPDDRFLEVIEPGREGVDLVAWAAAQRDSLRGRLRDHGAILFRGFGIDSVERFQSLVRAVSDDLLDYSERAAPRHEVAKSVYTSTEFPPDQNIPMHHEMSYSHNWPAKIWFYCAQAAATGGRTPIADDRRVLARLDPGLRQRFIDRKVMYVRNYGEGVDLPWQEAFQTDDRQRVEEYCRAARMTCEWKGEDRLRTRTARPATVVHPETGETIWFNHAHMFHVSNLEPAVRDALLAEFREDELPRNAFYGDGSPIEASVLDEIRGVYDDVALRFDWQPGDVALLDNFLTSHGRERFTGPRKILVAMAELYTSGE